MITTQKQFDNLLRWTEAEAIPKLQSERKERTDLLDKFFGLEGFDEQIAMLETEISQIDLALTRCREVLGNG